MSRFSFDPYPGPADAYRQFYRSAVNTTGRPATDAPARPAESATTPSERAIPQADGEP